MSSQNTDPRAIPCEGFLANNERIECGLFDVPLDWAHPEAGRSQLHYTRYRTKPDVEREGTIFVVPTYHPATSPLSLSTPEQMWTITTAPLLHNGTEGRYDIVIWTARGYPARQSGPGLTTPGHTKCFAQDEKRAEFYRRASKELGIEPIWGEKMEFLREQTYEDARNWLQLQARMIDECLRKQNNTILSYLGTAATVRDLVAMADAFDGPGSAVNFWGTDSGTLIGEYLLQMFPERAGRVLLQAPKDLQAYIHEDTYETWKKDLLHAGDTLGRFVEFCVKNDKQDCSTYVHDQILDADGLSQVEHSMFVHARNAYIGWRNALSVDLNNTALASVFRPVAFGNTTYNAAETLNGLQHVEHLAGWTLSMVPVFCGDKAADYDPEVAIARTREIGALLSEDIHLAPLFSSSVFPSLNYLCHLWPVRAVERLTEVNDQPSKTPAVAPLVIQYSANPFARRRPLSHVVPGVQNARSVVQMKFGIHLFRPETCMSNIIFDYLKEGKLPGRSVCYGNPDLDTVAKGVLEPTDTETTPVSQWRKFEHSEARSTAIAMLGLAAIVAIVIMMMSRRGSRSRLVQSGRDMTAVKS
ncbi:hypothetical protein GY45DRAFT_1327028 [Cubamyces sp. BRFM 1775]|nr:hypothetical protein GY45DRAFT_1327028 [Cubamyces sp. BRFM 1775]